MSIPGIVIPDIGMGVAGAGGAVPVSYATWNPADKAASVGLTGGNLIATMTAFTTAVRSTIGKSSGKWYWEVSMSEVASSTLIAGIATAAATVNSYPGSEATSWGAYPQGGGNQKINNNSSATVSGGNPIQANVPFGIALDMDAKTLSLVVNGITYSNIYTGLTGTIFAIAGIAFATGQSITANFGASAFAQAVPSGYNAGLYA